MPPLGFSLLALIVDASRLSERLFLSLALCIPPPFFPSVSLPFPPFSSYLSISGPYPFSLHSFSLGVFQAAFFHLSVCILFSRLPVSVSLSRRGYFGWSPTRHHLTLSVDSLSLLHSRFFSAVHFSNSISDLNLSTCVHPSDRLGVVCTVLFCIFPPKRFLLLLMLAVKMGVSIFFITPSEPNETSTAACRDSQMQPIKEVLMKKNRNIYIQGQMNVYSRCIYGNTILTSSSVVW